MTTPYIDPNLIFAENAPVQDKPAAFSNYNKGWDESRSNDGRPLIPQMNYLTQQADLKNLYIHENGAALPYKDGIAYEENAVVVKDGVLQQWKGGEWVRLNSADSILDESGETQQEINDSRIRTVFTKSDLLTINNHQNKQVAYVLENEKRYIYNSNLTATENGVTVIGKWEMEIQDAYYASWFCEAESGVDESVKLQTGYDYAVSKKRAFIVDIKVDVDPVRVGDNKVGLWVRSNSVLGFVGGGEIRMLTNNSTHYDVIRVQDVENYVINNPVLRGDRLTHTGTGGEWGYGLTVYQSKNGYIHKPRIYNMWGDGLYIGRIWGLNNSTTPTNVTIFEPYIEGARRNGISFTAGDNVNIIRPYITKVGDHDGVVGTWPKAGIDIEPEQATGTPLSSIVNSRITSATIKDCYAGVYLYLFSSGLHHTLTFDGVTTIDGASHTPIGLFHGGSDCTGLIHFEHIVIKPPYYIGLLHGWNGASALKCVIDRLTVLSTTDFILKHTLRGTYTEKVLGNLFVNNITANGSITHMFEEDVDGYVIGNVFRRGENHKGNFRYHNGKALNYAPEFMFDGVQTHTGWSTATKVYPNTIWQNPSVDDTGTIPIYLQASGDYRRLKVGLLNTTQIVGQGCNIKGLNLLIGGVAKTQARCKTLGGWLEFQNVNGGRTVIYDSYGDWTFS